MVVPVLTKIVRLCLESAVHSQPLLSQGVSPPDAPNDNTDPTTCPDGSWCGAVRTGLVGQFRTRRCFPMQLA